MISIIGLLDPADPGAFADVFFAVQMAERHIPGAILDLSWFKRGCSSYSPEEGSSLGRG